MNIAPNETTDTTLRLTERFKAAYHTLGLPQRTVARILRLKRAQIDDYQQGIAIPLEREVAELEHRVTERSRALQAIDAASNSFSLSSQMPSPQLTMEEMFSSYLKRWVVAWDEWRVRYPSEANRADLFFFSPECLSISDLAFGDRVAAHLEQFVDHHFFWIVDGYTIEKLWGEVMALKRIEARIVNDPSSMASGKIHFYPITIGNSEKELSEFYDKLRSSQDNRGRLTLHPLIDIA